MLASQGSRLQKAQNTKKIIKREKYKNPCVFAKYEKRLFCIILFLLFSLEKYKKNIKSKMTLQKSKSCNGYDKNLLLILIGQFQIDKYKYWKTVLYKIGRIFVITCPAYYMNRRNKSQIKIHTRFHFLSYHWCQTMNSH